MNPKKYDAYHALFKIRTLAFHQSTCLTYLRGLQGALFFTKGFSGASSSNRDADVYVSNARAISVFYVYIDKQHRYVKMNSPIHSSILNSLATVIRAMAN